MITTFHIFINGTSVRYNGGLAYRLSKSTQQDAHNKVVYIPACDFNNPHKKDLGKIFTWNLADQIDSLVKETILPAVEKHKNPQDKVRVKVYGLSRGGIGGFLLCTKVKHIPHDKLEIYMATIDPVPGNFKCTSWIDRLLGLDYTLTNQTSDLSDCQNLKRLLIILANKPYKPAYASLFPILPSQCVFKLEIFSGLHGELEKNPVIESQIKNFLNSCGEYTVTPQEVSMFLEAYQTECAKAVESERGMHLGNRIFTQVGPNRIYWNEHHQRLVNARLNPSQHICRLQDNVSRYKTKKEIIRDILQALARLLKTVCKTPLHFILAYSRILYGFKIKKPRIEEHATPVPSTCSTLSQRELEQSQAALIYAFQAARSASAKADTLHSEVLPAHDCFSPRFE